MLADRLAGFDDARATLADARRRRRSGSSAKPARVAETFVDDAGDACGACCWSASAAGAMTTRCTSGPAAR